MTFVRISIFAVALIAGGIAAFLALGMRGSSTPTPVAAEPPRPDVLVASTDIGEGWKLTPQNVRWQSWPEGAINPAFIQRRTMPDAIEKLQGSVVRSEFAADEPIREIKLARVESGFLSAILKSGMRAVAVRVQASNTAGGFVLPKDRVDVILTTTQQAGTSAAHNVSQTILTNVKVLAIDQTIEEDEKGGPVLAGKTATLELKPRQAELLTAAESNGSLSLALRSYEDTVVGAAEGDPSHVIAGARSSTINVIRHAVVTE
jgi:pilus assembly protein CpaB